ncbi:uncharacterized protein MYCFIDRAFT_43719 [Pseudocercospora fijiensis CIRAD86]|uniref:DUF4385 domain-containing protein n=1 Tax=Pseudocercospora fijiensis (strain CIRAD86) TaxID=383855 RepID=M3A2Z5_PSEFD|nr:uncharacterized protein MYCFIDRAFT_43719 [Pseudocercospora fijiensis CIRAD86]EME78951.1 hypothetical protein MYCFIDRAFT_43719 [Pseudocercospora fijiensis CIRAD86]
MPHRALKKDPTPTPPTLNDDAPDIFPTPALHSQNLRLSYEIARGEQGVLTFEPYKSILLPHWRFRTVPMAEESSKTLESAFEFYVGKKDLVGADMARKFLQMGMTRAKRYANHAGGLKYKKSSLENKKEAKRTQLPKSTGHKGMEEKLAASEVFQKVWRRCIEDAEYVKLKEEWRKEKKAYIQAGGKVERQVYGSGKKERKDEDIDSKIKIEDSNDD